MTTERDRIDAIVIGSGFGGAVTAARLAGAGMRVLVLERGPWWGQMWTDEKPSARPYPRGFWGSRKLLRGIRWGRGTRGRSLVMNRDGLLEFHLFDRMNAITGSGVGGGSLIYGDVQARPDDAFFDFFPDEISAAEMKPYFDCVKAVMRPSPFPVKPQRSAILERLGWIGHQAVTRAELAVRWADGSTGGGQLRSTGFLVGCELEGKRSLDKTYLSLAVRNGARILALCEATTIERSAKRYRVHWIDHARRTRRNCDAPVVVVSAGTLGTLRLLFAARDRDRSLRIPSSLGRHFSSGGDMTASLFQCPGAEDSAYGPSPGAGLRFYRDGEHSFLILESGLPFESLPLPRLVRERLKNSIGLAGMGRDSSDGVISFDGRELHTSTSRAQDREFYRRMEVEMAWIAHRYRPAKVSFERGDSARLMTVHPVGGASIAKDPGEGVVDHTGQVFGNPGLYVADASLFPKSPGWPPSMTIAALAERQAHFIASR